MSPFTLKVITFLISCSLSCTLIAAEHPIIQDFKKLTQHCETKNILDWLKQIKQLETKIYNQSYQLTQRELYDHYF